MLYIPYSLYNVLNSKSAFLTLFSFLLLCIKGATIKTEEASGKIVIARVMHGGAADRSGLIHVGDEVVEVNGINVEGKTPADVLTILVNSKKKEIK